MFQLSIIYKTNAWPISQFAKLYPRGQVLKDEFPVNSTSVATKTSLSLSETQS